jgi:hypothetical protein
MLLGVLLVCADGCGRGQTDQGAAGPSDSGTAEKGPVKVTLAVTPNDLDFSQHAEVRLEVISEPGVTVNVEDYERALREGEHRFEIGVVRSTKTETPTPTDDGKLVSTYRYELEFFLPGEYELPPATLTFVDQRGMSREPDSQSEERAVTVEELQTEPLTITAREEPGGQLSPEQLRTIKTLAPIELPTVWSRWWWLGPLTAAVVVIAAVLLVPRLRRLLARILQRDRSRRVIPIPAHEWARRQIAALIAEDLVGRGLFQEFHYRISYIVRGYIERRYGVSAAEMTTEEFLVAALTDNRFGSDTTAGLKEFLTACDMVKYARHEPTTTESDGALRAAEAFVERTCQRRPGERPVTASQPAVEERAA